MGSNPRGIPAARVRVPVARGLDRARLTERLGAVWDRRLALVVAPAGSGKTTLLAQFAAGAGCPVAWYRAEPADSSADAVLAHLARATGDALGVAGRSWASVEEAVAALEQWPGRRAAVVVDDLHELHGTEAEQALGTLIRYLPPSIVLVAGSRRQPAFNLSALRVADELLELDGDDLRFRSWEVERLFREIYVEPLPPEDLNYLAQRTEGWAAGLQLFHLATSGKSVAARHRLLHALASSSPLVREYLAANVLAELPEELRRFLVATSPLGRLTAPLCDELLGRHGCAELLEELERRQVFTMVLDDGSYRYHEVLRAYLESVLIDETGEREAHRRYAHAGRLLEAAGALTDALRAYSRAEEAEAVRRLLGRDGEHLVEDQGGWVDALPAAVVEGDPWLLLAGARRAAMRGRWRDGIDRYRQAEAAFTGGGGADVCRRERFALAAALDPAVLVPATWYGAVLEATRRDPWKLAGDDRSSTDPAGRLAAAVAGLLDTGEVAGRLVDDLTMLDSTPLLAAAARVLGTMGMGFEGCADDDLVADVEGAAAEAERAGSPWLARIARAQLARTARADGVEEADAARAAAEHECDDWGAGLAGLAGGLGRMSRGLPAVAALDQAAAAFRSVGAAVLEAWCRSAAALAEAGDCREGTGRPEDAAGRAAAADLLARSAGSRGARALALLAVGTAAGPAGASDVAEARALAAAAGFDLHLDDDETADVDPEQDGTHTAGAGTLGSGTLTVRCFGPFSVHRDAEPVGLGGLRPRARATLQLLAAAGGNAVHREVIAEALWPEQETASASRAVQVAVSAIRQAIGGDVAREGDAYRLDTGDIDVAHFETALRRASDARAGRDGEAEAEALTDALGWYVDDLLPERGPEEWVVKARERLRREVIDAAARLAELHLAAGDPSAAVVVAERGLAIEPLVDGLWRLLIAAHDQAGDRAGVARSRASYDRALAELGLPASGPL